MTQPCVISPLGPHHDRGAFACGVEALDAYLRTGVGQDVRRRIAKCYVLHEEGSSIVRGYYTLSASSIPLAEMTDTDRKKLPRYPLVPAFLLGRLAVDSSMRRRGFGEMMVFDAADRANRSDAGVHAIVVDAKDEAAAAFYRRLGFSPLPSKPLSLALPVSTALAALR